MLRRGGAQFRHLLSPLRFLSRMFPRRHDTQLAMFASSYAARWGSHESPNHRGLARAVESTSIELHPCYGVAARIFVVC